MGKTTRQCEYSTDIPLIRLHACIINVHYWQCFYPGHLGGWRAVRDVHSTKPVPFHLLFLCEHTIQANLDVVCRKYIVKYIPVSPHGPLTFMKCHLHDWPMCGHFLGNRALFSRYAQRDPWWMGWVSRRQVKHETWLIYFCCCSAAVTDGGLVCPTFSQGQRISWLEELIFFPLWLNLHVCLPPTASW